MAEEAIERDCVSAFKEGNKPMAEQLLRCMPQPAAVTTTFIFRSGLVKMVSLLHLAAYWDWEDVVTELVTVHGCSIECKDKNGHIPLHYTAYNGHLQLTKYFAKGLCSLSIGNFNGETPLHLSCEKGHINIVQYLISEAQCNLSFVTNHDNTPLHFACSNGHLKIVQYLIKEAHCYPSCKTNYGNTPLHFACSNGHLDITHYLISEAHCNPSCRDNVGKTPLHYACRNGHLKIVKYLINDANCNPSCENNIGNTPLHLACSSALVYIAQYLIEEAHCNPSYLNNNGSTPLHYACIYHHAHIVQYLLSTGKVNPLAENKSGRTAMYFGSSNYDIINLFQPFEECKITFPVHTFTKLILTGDSGAGKTSLTELIVRLATHSSTAIECVADVQCFTAGIVPHHIQSELGNFIVYDFAGQQEYYSSHAAVLEHVMQKSAVMFLCLVDLSKSNESICQSLHYWLSFINNACSSVAVMSHVAIVGSHSDLVQSSEEKKGKSSLIQAMAIRKIVHQDFAHFAGYLSMDCRQGNTDASRQLVSMLTNSQNAINTSQPVISFYCHVLYAFLRTKLDVVGCSFQYLTSAITEENDSSLPNDPSVLTELLTTLSDKGLILFLNSPQSSWIVVKTEYLLNEVNGVLFAPPHFKEHRVLASNTGIVPASTLCEVFPKYDHKMLLGFLESLDFCRPVDPSVLQYTNLQTTPSQSTADLFFFPGLVQSERPDNLIQQATLQFGWSLGCVDEYQFLSSRFLHMLLLSVAYKFPLASRFSPSSSVSGLQRMCTVWKNGISWRDDNNITTVIELLDNNRQVLVAMSCNSKRPVECGKLRSSVIGIIRHLQQVHCASVEVREYLISPDLVCQYPLGDVPDTNLFDMYNVARSILHCKPIVLSYKDGRGCLDTTSLPLEPYHLIAQLAPRYVCQLFNPNMADQPVPEILLREVRKHFNISTPQVYKELREQMDGLSIFAGNNPLVSSVAVLLNVVFNSFLWCVQEVAELKEEDLPSDDPPTAGTSDKPCSTSLSESQYTHVHKL